MLLSFDPDIILQATANTLMGMGVVFMTLIFISFLISLFKFLPNGNKKNKATADAANKKARDNAPKAPTVTEVADEELVDDSELVAVITAAIYAASGSQNNSKDTLVVRSIRRAKRN